MKIFLVLLWRSVGKEIDWRGVWKEIDYWADRHLRA
jgi:hypothetical protein